MHCRASAEFDGNLAYVLRKGPADVQRAACCCSASLDGVVRKEGGGGGGGVQHRRSQIPSFSTPAPHRFLQGRGRGAQKKPRFSGEETFCCPGHRVNSRGGVPWASSNRRCVRSMLKVWTSGRISHQFRVLKGVG